MNIVYTRSSTIYDDSRATKEIIALLDKGHHISVLGWNRNGLAEKQCRKLFKEYGTQIKLSFFDENDGSTRVKKMAKRLKWGKWLKHELQNEPTVDLIHACDYDTGAIVCEYANDNGIKYIYDIYDYYVDAHPVPALLKKYIEKKETDVINKAALVIICTEERRNQISHATPRRLIVIHNSPEVVSVKPSKENYDYTYCGSLYAGRLLKEIFEKYSYYKQFKMAIAGYGEYEHCAKTLSDKFQNFTYFGSIPYADVLEIEKQSKVISAIYEPTIRNHQLCAPNKFYEALALGKPVIVCRGTGIDRVVIQEKIGCVIDYDAKQFYDALDYLVCNDAVRKEMGEKARKLYEQKYKWSLMRERLLYEYDRL